MLQKGLRAADDANVVKSAALYFKVCKVMDIHQCWHVNCVGERWPSCKLWNCVEILS